MSIVRTTMAVVCGVAAVHAAFAQDIEAGKRKAETCIPCHGVNGHSSQPTFPILAGQTARYIYLQLRDFKEGRRKDPSMDPIAAGLSREDMFDLAAFFAAQRPMSASFTPDPQKVAAGERIASDALCTMCHLGGFSGQNEIPRVAGQYPQYIAKQLKAFRDKTRTNDAGNMTAYTRSLSDADIDALAQYVGNLQ